MREVSDYLSDEGIESIANAINTFDSRLARLERDVASRLLVEYPNREKLEELADRLLERLETELIQVNSIGASEQTTVATAPPTNPLKSPLDQTFCVMTVISGESLSISDVSNESMISQEARDSPWGSWASAPIVVSGLNAGSVCALESHSREWTDSDQEALQATARSLAAEIETWIAKRVNDVNH